MESSRLKMEITQRNELLYKIDAETQMAGRKIPVFPSGDSSKMDIIGYQWRYNDIDIYDICILLYGHHLDEFDDDLTS